MNDNIKTFYLMWSRGDYIYYLLVILIWILSILYWLPIYVIIVGLLYQVLMIEVFGLKVEVYENKLIVYKILGKEKVIPFSSIESVTKGRRAFYGQILANRDALIISYIESSGYKCELSDLYHEKMYTCIDSYFSAYRKLNKS